MAVFYKYQYTNKLKNIHPWSSVYAQSKQVASHIGLATADCDRRRRRGWDCTYYAAAAQAFAWAAAKLARWVMAVSLRAVRAGI